MSGPYIFYQPAALNCADYLQASAGLLDAVAQPHAVPVVGVFDLRGSAAVLGRHQRASSAIRLEEARRRGTQVLRRPTGGRALSIGEGIAAVALALPAPGALTGEALPVARLVNRAVRGVLAAGAILGAPCYYFGRDSLSMQSRPFGYVSFEARKGGASLVEVFLGVEREVALAWQLDGYPPRQDAVPPPEVTFAQALGRVVSFEEVSAAVHKGFERAYGTQLEDGGELPLGALLVAEEEETGLARSGVAEVPIGFVEALVARQGNCIARARVRGDFLCASEVVSSLEQAVLGLPLELPALGAAIDRVFKDPLAALIGVRELRIFAEALLAASMEPPPAAPLPRSAEG